MASFKEFEAHLASLANNAGINLSFEGMLEKEAPTIFKSR